MAEDPDAIRREIADTREEMSDTIDALEYKADVRARAIDKAAEVRETIAERVDGVLSSLRGSARRAGDSMRGGVDVTKGTMQQTTTDVADRAREGVRRGAGTAEDNPLILAVGAAAAGFLIGMALPGTRMEDEKLGATSDRVRSEAMDRGQQMVERVGETAREVVERASDRAENKVEEMRGSSGTTPSGGTTTSTGTTTAGDETDTLPPIGTYGTGV